MSHGPGPDLDDDGTPESGWSWRPGAYLPYYPLGTGPYNQLHGGAPSFQGFFPPGHGPSPSFSAFVEGAVQRAVQAALPAAFGAPGVQDASVRPPPPASSTASNDSVPTQGGPSSSSSHAVAAPAPPARSPPPVPSSSLPPTFSVSSGTLTTPATATIGGASQGTGEPTYIITH